MDGFMPDLAGLKILVVEDNEDLVRFHVRWMEKSGVSPVYSLTGNGGVEQLRENPDVDVVILDMNLPDITGDKVFVELRQIKPELPVIFYSGYSNLLGGIEAQANIRILSKPFYLPTLKDMVAEMVGRPK